MSSLLPPMMPQPTPTASRDMAGAFSVDGQRPLRPARDAETARAPRPVDPVHQPADMRLPTRRDKLVGPVPAFVRNMIQYLFEKTMETPRPEAALPEFDGAPPPIGFVTPPETPAEALANAPLHPDAATSDPDAMDAAVTDADTTDNAPRETRAEPSYGQYGAAAQTLNVQPPSGQGIDLKL